MRLFGVLVLALVALIGAQAYIFSSTSLFAFDSAGYGAQLAERWEASESRPNFRALSAERAYSRIPHPRTPFRPDFGRMTAREARYLEALFRLTDVGVVERVYLQEQVRSGAMGSPETTNYGEILAGLRGLSTPDHLRDVEALIFEAIGEQSRYLEDWRQTGIPGYFSADAALVQSSHRKLIAAYQRLIRLYENEGRHNKQAFYDHLCALDFI